LLVAQDLTRVEGAHKTTDKRWIIGTYEGLDAVVSLESLGVSLLLVKIYASVELRPTVE